MHFSHLASEWGRPGPRQYCQQLLLKQFDVHVFRLHSPLCLTTRLRSTREQLPSHGLRHTLGHSRFVGRELGESVPLQLLSECLAQSIPFRSHSHQILRSPPKLLIMNAMLLSVPDRQGGLSFHLGEGAYSSQSIFHLPGGLCETNAMHYLPLQRRASSSVADTNHFCWQAYPLLLMHWKLQYFRCVLLQQQRQFALYTFQLLL
mmetsp:Transcript_19932/g.46548  ORF Transcript_19932/g.46548 Transcript_19932/m.46548 type:complete len:204 (-) Transcript_19932:1521-2132(-)